MKKAAVCVFVAAAGALVAATSVESASARLPRFLVTIVGSQHYEWNLEQSDSQCSFRGRGEQSETFGTSKPVKVIAPRGAAGKYEFQAYSRRGWGRAVPLTGRETRTYGLLRPPSGACPGLQTELKSNCRGTNPLLPRAGVVLMRVGQKVALHVPVDTPWIPRRPSVCDIRLFDLRNYYFAAVFGLRTYKLVRGGRFESGRAKTLRVAISAPYCIDPSKSSDFEVVLDTTCGAPPAGRRGAVLTGSLTTTWSITFRRTR